MSPRRRVRRPTPRQFSWHEVAYAVLAVVGVAVSTALAIWLIRPGGIASNQPRIATVLAVAVIGFLVAFSVSQTPDRPVVGRLTLWGTVVMMAVVCVAAGALVEELASISWALQAGIWTGAAILAVAAFGECTLLVRRWSQGSLLLGALLSLGLALLTGAATSLIWKGDLYITRVKPEQSPLVPVAPGSPSATFPLGVGGVGEPGSPLR